MGASADVGEIRVSDLERELNRRLGEALAQYAAEKHMTFEEVREIALDLLFTMPRYGVEG